MDEGYKKSIRVMLQMVDLHGKNVIKKINFMISFLI